MHIENISLASLTRSTRGIGVTDLREALEGRGNVSNPNLARAPSVSTMDHPGVGTSSLYRYDSRTITSKKRGHPPGTGEVKDVLNRLGIGKQNATASRLKSSFPAKGEPRCVALLLP